MKTPRKCPACAARFTEAVRFPAVGSCCPLCLAPLPEPSPATKRPGKNRAPSISGAGRRRRIRSLLLRDGGGCWLCGRPLGDDVTLDHVVPRSKGGSNAMANLRLAHKACNRERADRDA